MEERNREHLRRAVWPEVVFPEDLALVLRISESESERSLRAGQLGPFLEVRGRPAALRRDLLESLSRRAGAGPVDREVLGGEKLAGDRARALEDRR